MNMAMKVTASLLDPDADRTPATSDCTVADLIFAQARRTPDAIAITADGRSHSYAELDEATRRIAATVRRELGATRDVLVGVSAGRGFAMVATLVGVMRAGAAYLPLDPDLPAARIASIVGDARPRLLLVDAAGAASPAFATMPVVAIEDALGAQPIGERPPVQRDGGASSLAYVIYTSGSTGRPKGVEIEHAGVVNLIRSIAVEPGFGPGDTMLAVTRMGFDISVLCTFLPLATGGHLVLADQSSIADPRRLADAIASSGATVLNATPATWRGLIATGWKGSSLLRAWCGGEAMTTDLADALLPRCRELWNCYGPTETTVWSTMQPIHPGSPISIGEPIAETGIHILDEALRPVEDGQTGELCISGIGLARGYRGRPELTGERFPTLPGGTRIYRTGDLARRGVDGALFCAGRIDDQVKIRGYRVEMGEVEAVLCGHRAVAACAVRCWPDGIGENMLVAYVVPKNVGDLPIEALLDHVRAALPAYMVPQRIVALVAMPLTPNGKFDRNALPPPADGPPAPAAAPPADPIEGELVGIWRELLGVSDIGAESDFFDLGGYSLLTVHLQCRIEERFGAELSLSDLLAASSLAAMADAVRGGTPRGGWRPIPLRPEGSRPPLYWLDGGPLIRTVARAMRGDHPVIGVNLTIEEERRLNREGVRIEEIADVMAARLTELAPAGPLYLGGWCRWGVIAYETARRLRASGRGVDELILLDAQCSSALSRSYRRVTRWLDAFRQSQVRGASFGDRLDAAAESYAARAYGGTVSLMLPSDTDGRRGFDGGWRRHVDRVRIVVTPGDHVSMVRHPHAKMLAAAFDEALLHAERQVDRVIAPPPRRPAAASRM